MQVIFGQLIVGPPGSGKSTYALAMYRYLSQLGRRPIYINLDPGCISAVESQDDTDTEPMECIDVRDLIQLEDAMDEFGLGPNGGLLYCMDFLLENIAWLTDKILALLTAADAQVIPYLLIDCPGQVELFTQHRSFLSIIEHLTKEPRRQSSPESLGLRLTCVQLVDAAHCTDASRYISVLVCALRTMMYISLPTVHVLSKVDLMESQNLSAFNLEFYTEVGQLEYLLDQMHHDDTVFGKKYRKLSTALCEMVEDFGMVHFQPLCVDDLKALDAVLRLVDRAGGHVFADDSIYEGVDGRTEHMQMLNSVSMRDETDIMDIASIQERYLGDIVEHLT